MAGSEWENARPRIGCRSGVVMSGAGEAPFRSYLCVVCGFIYNEAEGLPEEGIAPGTRWADIPDTWTCPDCGVGKEDFEMVEIG